MEPGTDVIARRIVIEGRVQGVFFRAAAADAAHRFGVTGWVANRPDGAVEAHVEGPPGAIERMIAWCHEGPELARVEHVRDDRVSPIGATDFAVRAHPGRP